MSVDTQWEDLVAATGDPINHFRLNEASTSFYDVISEYTVPFASGITTEQDSSLIRNTIDKSILGTASVSSSPSADLALPNGDLTGPWTVWCRFKWLGGEADDNERSIFALGDNSSTGTGRNGLVLNVRNSRIAGQTTQDVLNVQIRGVGNIEWDGIDPDDYLDGEWHSVGLRFASSATVGSNFILYLKIDDGAWTAHSHTNGSPSGATAINGSPDTLPLRVLQNYAGSDSGNGVALDELVIYDTELTQANADILHDSAAVTGFPAEGGAHLVPNLGLGILD